MRCRSFMKSSSFIWGGKSPLTMSGPRTSSMRDAAALVVSTSSTSAGSSPAFFTSVRASAAAAPENRLLHGDEGRQHGAHDLRRARDLGGGRGRLAAPSRHRVHLVGQDVVAHDLMATGQQARCDGVSEQPEPYDTDGGHGILPPVRAPALPAQSPSLGEVSEGAVEAPPTLDGVSEQPEPYDTDGRHGILPPVRAPESPLRH